MLKAKAHIVFKLALCHTFFNDGLMKGLRIQPTESGHKQLAKAQCHVHAYHGGMAVYNRNSETESPVLKNLNVAFSVEISNPEFLNYTDWEAPGFGNIYYANNLGPIGKAIRWELLSLKGPQWLIDFSPFLPQNLGAKRHVRISRPNGAIVLEESFIANPKDASYKVDLLNESDGAYQLEYTAAGQTVTVSFFKWAPHLAKSVLGFFEWFGSQDDSGRNPTALGAEWIFQLQGRKTLWQYYLVQKRPNSFQNPSISPVHLEQKTIHFAKTNTDVVLPNGKHAIEFTSDDVLPLQEIPRMKIMLEASELAKGMQLPYASPELLYESNVPTVQSSKIYVYF